MLIRPQDADSTQDPGGKVVQFCALENGQYRPREELDIDSYSVVNTINWSADGRLITLIPLRWDGTGPCVAFYSDGSAYHRIDNPFDGALVMAVAFDPGAHVIATAATDGTLQLWEWAQGRFAKLPNTPRSYSAYSLPGRPYVRSLVFGTTAGELFAVTSGASNEVQVQLVNVPKQTASVLGVLPPKDQFPRLVPGPQASGKQLMATSLYGRVSLNRADAWNLKKAIAEPICFSGTTATPVFDSTGSRLLTLSGSIWLAPDTVQVWDVSVRVKGQNDEAFNADNKAAPPWLADLARAVSGIPRTWDVDDSATTLLSDVLERTPPATIHPPYVRVWKHFFPEQATGDR
ncbi:MAG: hypothetical protein JO069_12255 [Verrucomicrobia bacterium]|nr:hypothetical protein [Verrucomicrobiota bacterium]